jgi:hypothetical protein
MSPFVAALVLRSKPPCFVCAVLLTLRGDDVLPFGGVAVGADHCADADRGDSARAMMRAKNVLNRFMVMIVNYFCNVSNILCSSACFLSASAADICGVDVERVFKTARVVDDSPCDDPSDGAESDLSASAVLSAGACGAIIPTIAALSQ